MIRLRGKWIRDRFGWARSGTTSNGVTYRIYLYVMNYYGAYGSNFGWSTTVGDRRDQGVDRHQNTRDAKQWLDDRVRGIAEDSATERKKI